MKASNSNVIKWKEGLACLLSLSPLCIMKKMWRKVGGLSSLLNPMDFVIMVSLHGCCYYLMQIYISPILPKCNVKRFEQVFYMQCYISSWLVDKLGFWELNEEMKNLANQMNLEQMWEDIVRKAKEVTKSRLDLKSKGMVQILCN